MMKGQCSCDGKNAKTEKHDKTAVRYDSKYCRIIIKEEWNVMRKYKSMERDQENKTQVYFWQVSRWYDSQSAGWGKGVALLYTNSIKLTATQSVLQTELWRRWSQPRSPQHVIKTSFSLLFFTLIAWMYLYTYLFSLDRNLFPY